MTTVRNSDVVAWLAELGVDCPRISLARACLRGCVRMGHANTQESPMMPRERRDQWRALLLAIDRVPTLRDAIGSILDQPERLENAVTNLFTIVQLRLHNAPVMRMVEKHQARRNARYTGRWGYTELKDEKPLEQKRPIKTRRPLH